MGGDNGGDNDTCNFDDDDDVYDYSEEDWDDDGSCVVYRE